MLKNTFNSFFRFEAAGAVFLLLAAIAVMILKNSTFSDVYSSFLDIPIQIRIGALDIDKPLFLWVNEGLMAMFFFTIAMAVKREVMIGELSDTRRIFLPHLEKISPWTWYPARHKLRSDESIISMSDDPWQQYRELI